MSQYFNFTRDPSMTGELFSSISLNSVRYEYYEISFCKSNTY